MKDQYLYQARINAMINAKNQMEFDEAFAPFKSNEEYWKKELESVGVDFNRFNPNIKIETFAKDDNNAPEEVNVENLTKMIVDEPIVKAKKKK